MDLSRVVLLDTVKQTDRNWAHQPCGVVSPVLLPDIDLDFVRLIRGIKTLGLQSD